MRHFFVFLFLFLSFTTAKAHFLSEYSSSSYSEKPKSTVKKKDNSATVPTEKTVNTEKQTYKPNSKIKKKEQRKIAKTQRKQLRKTVWKALKEQRKVNKENKKAGIKNTKPKIHWAAYLSFFATLLALGIFVAAFFFATMYAIFSFLVPFAIGLLVVSLIASIIGISVVANDDTTLYHKSHTITLALIGGILAFLSLLAIGFIILAISALSF